MTSIFVPWDPLNTYLDSPNTDVANLNLAKKSFRIRNPMLPQNQLPQTEPKSEFEPRAIESDLDKMCGWDFESLKELKGSPKRIIRFCRL